MEGDVLFQSVLGPRFASVRSRLNILGANPPQVLLLEGGTETERKDAALYFACCCLCPNVRDKGAPCMSCPTCLQVEALENLDCFAFDGRLSNAQGGDESKIKTLSKETLLTLKSALKDPPHGRYKIVLLMGLESSLRSAAANALLKAMEEPSPTVVFILLVGQREQLLPTLVSRSHCLTLPWPDAGYINKSLSSVSQSISEFFEGGRGLAAVIPEKKFSADQANDYLSLLQAAIIRVLSGRFAQTKNPSADPLGAAMAKLPLWALSQAIGWLGEARSKILAQVSPGRVLEALLERLCVLLMRTRP